MATFSDGGGPALGPADPSAMRSQLQTLLDIKEKQLQSVGTLGQRILAQQSELEERIRLLHELEAERMDGEDIEDGALEKYQELAGAINEWDDENVELTVPFNTRTVPSKQEPAPPAPPAQTPTSVERERSSTPGPSAVQSSRRAKNAAHRANDAEFAFEIGSGLITEVRRLQSLLGERDKALQDMKEEKDDLDKTVEGLRTALREQEQNADKYKEENWNLEVTLQETRTQLSDVQATAQRLEGEQKRLTKTLATTREAADQHKSEAEKLQYTMLEIKSKHETDIAQARKFAAGLQRDKSDLQQALDTAKAEASRAARRLPRFGSPLTPNGSDVGPHNDGEEDEEDVFGPSGKSTNRTKTDTNTFLGDGFGSDYADSSPDPSPSKGLSLLSPHHPSNELEAVQQRYAHAQRKINTLQSQLQREKELRMELKRKYEGSSSTLNLADQDDEDISDVSAPPSRLTTPYRGRGRGRGRIVGSGSGRTLAQRLSMVSRSPSMGPDADEYEDIQEDDEEHAEFGEVGEGEDTVTEPLSNRASMDGLDPAFANVLRGSPSPQKTASPLRQSHIAGSTLRRRGGAAFQAPRPPSVVVSGTTALDAELGELRMSALDDDVPALEYTEIGCQTDVVEEAKEVASTPVAEAQPAAIVPVVEEKPAPVMSEVGVQGAPEVEAAAAIPKPVLVDSGMLTEPLATSEMQVQTPRMVTMDMDIQTSPESVQTLPDTPKTVRQRPASSLTDDDLDRRNTIVQADYADLSMSSQGTVRGAPGRAFLADDEGEETETGAETETEAETDTDDYEDARQSIAASTPTQSLSDFHSIVTVTDNDFSESEDDAESIRASQISRTRKRSFAPSVGSRSQAAGPSVSYDEQGIQAVAPEPPKPEVADTGIQTDEWVPPPPPAAPSPTRSSLTPGFGLVSAGPAGQQFQFISPPPSAGPTKLTMSPTRDSIATVIPSPRLPTLPISPDKRASVEVPTASADDGSSRPRAVSTLMDKTRPPTMMLPPPPRMPPPPNSMPPPSFVPDRAKRSSTSSAQDIPPPRPSSPPPPELIHRATTPTFGGSLLVPRGRAGGTGRQPGSSMPPQSLRQLPSNPSFRSGPHGASLAQFGIPTSRSSLEAPPRKGFSTTTSLASDQRSMGSRRSSVSSRGPSIPQEPVTPHKGDISQGTTDPEIIHAITQTMIGEFLWKYTRKTIGKGYGNQRHKRFFWVHPYTKTLYWSSADPGSSNVTESTSKSAYIEGVKSVLDPNPMPPGLYQHSVIIQTAQRDVKISAPTKERHDIWLNALQYLLARPAPNPGGTTTPGVMSPNDSTARPGAIAAEVKNMVNSSPHSQRSARSGVSTGSWNHTPKGQRSLSQLSLGGSVGKRAGTPALEYLRWAGSEDPVSPTAGRSLGGGFEHIPPQDEDDLDFELHEHEHDEPFEGLENVRACCDGAHTVGGHHHHHHHHNHDLQPVNLDNRPISPSGWSFRSRSRAGSTTSNDGERGTGGSIFTWGQNKFGSRRSTRPPAQEI